MGFEERKKRKYEGVEKFIEKIKEIQEEAKAALGRAQEEMKKYTDRKRKKADNYKVEDLVMLSTKDLKYQIVGRRTEKLIERFIDSYKIKKIILLNVCHKLHSVISPSILRRFPRSQSQLKALKKTFRSMPVTSRDDQYWPRY